MKKQIMLAAAIAALLGVIALGAVEISRGGGMLLKIWVFITLMLTDIYVKTRVQDKKHPKKVKSAA